MILLRLLTVTMVVLSMPALSPARGGKHFSGTGFSLTLPRHWIEIPGDALEGFSQNLRKDSSGSVQETYEYGFQPGKGQTWFSFPYVLVQVKKSGKISLSDLQDYPAIKGRIEPEMPAAWQVMQGVKKAKGGEFHYDPERQVLFHGAVATFENGRDVKNISASYLTEEGMIAVHAYAVSSEYGQHADEFYRILNSVNIAEELKYKAGHVKAGEFVRNLLICGAVLAAAGFLAAFIRRREG